MTTVILPSSIYDEYSLPVESMYSYKGCRYYQPDNYDDYTCIGILQPDPELGARTWTRNGKRILLAIYRDEGRDGAFAETHVVFRLLPSFKLLKLTEVQAILSAANPALLRRTVALTDITTGQIKQESEVRVMTPSANVPRAHRQQLNEYNKPLPQQYDSYGRVILQQHRFAKSYNAQLYLTPPFISQHQAQPPASNDRLYSYDFYGFDLNDQMREPYYSNRVVYYDSSSPLGIARATNSEGELIYKGKLHDMFGDFVVGARANNTLITRKPVQPLTFDHHNMPLKAPVKKNSL